MKRAAARRLAPQARPRIAGLGGPWGQYTARPCGCLHKSNLTAGSANAICCSTTMHSIARRKSLSPLEQVLMDYVWTHPACTAETCREALSSRRAFKESTIRTILKNLEKKGYVTHEVRGRTFFYQAVDTKRSVTKIGRASGGER